MCMASFSKIMELRTKLSPAKRLEDSIEKRYGIRPFGIKMMEKAAGQDTKNAYYQEGGRGYSPPAPTGSDIYSKPTHSLSIGKRKE